MPEPRRIQRETRYERDRCEAMKSFLRRFRHEIATPLSGANLHLEVALRRLQKPGGFDMPAVVENLRTCQKSLDSAAQMLELIAETVQDESCEPSEFSLLESLASGAEPLRGEARARGLTLELPSAAPGPRWFGSAKVLDSVFAELTRNAVEHSSPPGAIRWTVKEEQSGAVLECRSPGRLPLGDPEHLFGVAKGEGSSGRGFGLLQARLAIQSNGADLTVSQEGGDVCASVRFEPREG
jgi:signal transduction histidine kinase